MAYEIHISRLAGHPWDGRAGFDLLEYSCETREESVALVENAEEKFWHPWLVHGTCSNETFPFGGVMYKPSAILSDWSDSPGSPHPGNFPQ